jgi:biotin carboxyl carrier protein
MQPWSSHWGSWRMSGESGRPRRKVHIAMPDPVDVTCTSNRDGSFDISWMDTNKDETEKEVTFRVTGTLYTDGNMEVIVDNTQRIKLTAVMKEDDGLIRVRMWPEFSTIDKNDYYWEIDFIDPMSVTSENPPSGLVDNSHKKGEVKSPMPGKISRVNFRVGDSVKVGDVIVVMEAMKMEHNCSSPWNGIISEIKYEPNSVVPDGAILVIVTANDVESTPIATV